jgi:hypothetical protein
MRMTGKLAKAGAALVLAACMTTAAVPQLAQAAPAARTTPLVVSVKYVAPVIPFDAPRAQPLDNTHCLTPKKCYSYLMVAQESKATSHCDKVSSAAASLAAGAVAVTTSPVDVAGISVVAIFTWLGAKAFCSIGWW